MAQFYSPKELRSLVFFIGLGLLSLIYRLLDSPVKHEISFLSDPQYHAEARASDSLFAVLTRRKALADSFYFYAPDTTEVVSTRRNTNSKASSLAANAISLNRASRDELVRLPAVGEATADLILEYRKERGKFRSLTEVMNVRGIGPKKFERMKRYLRLE